MKLAVLKERRAHEKRVAATPDTVKKLIALGFDVSVEKGAGLGASVLDAAFEAAGATIAKDAATTAKGAAIVLKVQGPEAAEIKHLPKGAVLVSTLNPFGNKDGIDALAKAGVTAFAMEMMPRITRAQSMDVLSSQSNLAGYKAVLDAAEHSGKAYPMMMTAAGTVAPAKIFVMGAGVAGLQAIATAKRLGAVVTATDVRPAVKEQVESLGGKFIMVESDEVKEAETAGGYAKEMSDDYKRQQAELVAKHVTTQDVVITTALIPGRPAPKLITAEMVKSMKPGAVLVDLAVEQGGNVEGAKAGEIVDMDGVKIVGHINMASRLAPDASALYARNLLNFITLIVDAETKAIKIDWDDEIITGTAVAHEGAVVHPALKGD